MGDYIFSGVSKVNAAKPGMYDKNIADYFTDTFIVEEPIRLSELDSLEKEAVKILENSKIVLAALAKSYVISDSRVVIPA